MSKKMALTGPVQIIYTNRFSLTFPSGKIVGIRARDHNSVGPILTQNIYITPVFNKEQTKLVYRLVYVYNLSNNT